MHKLHKKNNFFVSGYQLTGKNLVFKLTHVIYKLSNPHVALSDSETS